MPDCHRLIEGVMQCGFPDVRVYPWCAPRFTLRRVPVGYERIELNGDVRVGRNCSETNHSVYLRAAIASSCREISTNFAANFGDKLRRWKREVSPCFYHLCTPGMFVLMDGIDDGVLILWATLIEGTKGFNFLTLVEVPGFFNTRTTDN